MSRRLRQHINPLKLSCLVPREDPLDLPDGPLEVELGCGDAHFLLELAGRHPARFYLGLDIRGPFLDEGRAEACRLGLTNVSLIASNLQVDAERLFPPERVARFYINFPDPWFKRRHHNRRWLTGETLGHLVRALAPGGEIFFQSDVWALALEALGLLEESPALHNTRGEWTFLGESPFPARSSREIACLAEGRPIWRMLFHRGDRGPR